MAQELTQERLKELLSYDPETGVFTWLIKRGSTPEGSIAGNKHASGYVYIGHKKKLFAAHRLAWFYVHGVWPVIIDHRDRVRSNNRLSNLRNVKSDQENMENLGKRVTNTTGFMGVTRSGLLAKPFKAQIVRRGQHHHLGVFVTAEEASTAYEEARVRLNTSVII